jgi:hypothetical protein
MRARVDEFLSLTKYTTGKSRRLAEMLGVRASVALVDAAVETSRLRMPLCLVKGLEGSLEQAKRLLEGWIVPMFSMPFHDEMFPSMFPAIEPVIPYWLLAYVLERSDFYLTAAFYHHDSFDGALIKGLYEARILSITAPGDWEVVAGDETQKLLCHPMLPHPSHFRTVPSCGGSYAAAAKTPVSLMDFLSPGWCPDAGSPCGTTTENTARNAMAETASPRVVARRWSEKELSAEEPSVVKKKKNLHRKRPAKLVKERRKTTKADHRNEKNWHAKECLTSHALEAEEYADYLRDEREWLNAYAGDRYDSDYDW